MKSICKNMFNCPVEATIRLIGGKYKAVILWHLMNQTLRYNEIHKRIPNATDKMLAQQLRELEKDGLINRTVYPVVPPKTEYSLTDFGQTLAPILDAMCDWGTNYLNGYLFQSFLHISFQKTASILQAHKTGSLDL